MKLVSLLMLGLAQTVSQAQTTAPAASTTIINTSITTPVYRCLARPHAEVFGMFSKIQPFLAELRAYHGKVQLAKAGD